MGSEIDKLISTHSAPLCLFVQVGQPNGRVHAASYSAYQSKEGCCERNGGVNKEVNVKR